MSSWLGTSRMAARTMSPAPNRLDTTPASAMITTAQMSDSKVPSLFAYRTLVRRGKHSQYRPAIATMVRQTRIARQLQPRVPGESGSAELRQAPTSPRREDPRDNHRHDDDNTRRSVRACRGNFARLWGDRSKRRSCCPATTDPPRRSTAASGP